MFKQKKLVTMAMALILVAAAVTLFSALGDGSALAARGGKGGGKGSNAGGTTPSTATLAVSPNPPAAGEVFTVSGTGFTPGAALNFGLGSFAAYTTADQTGYASLPWTIALPGTYTISACQFTSKGCQQVGSITFTVQ